MGTINRKPFLKRSSVRKKRPGPPRRGRVVDTAFIQWMHETQFCLVAMKCRHRDKCYGRGTFHHIRESGSPKNDRRGLFLCEAHHLHDGPESIERLGKKEFERRHGVDIEAAITEYNRRYGEETGR